MFQNFNKKLDTLLKNNSYNPSRKVRLNELFGDTSDEFWVLAFYRRI